MRSLLNLRILLSSRVLLTWAGILAGVSWCAPARAQATTPLPMPGQSGSIYAAITKLYGDTTGFSSKAEMTAKERTGEEMVRLTMGFAVLDGKIRMDIDINTVKSARMTSSTRDQMKKMGMEQMSMVIRPDRQMTLLIYPGLKSCVEMPMSEEDKTAYAHTPNIETTAAGKETIDGHPCVKNKLVITEPTGKKHEGIAWIATDMKNFPLQTQFAELDTDILIRYKSVQFSRPDSARFDAPEGYAKYTDIQQFMQYVMQKMTGTPGQPSRK